MKDFDFKGYDDIVDIISYDGYIDQHGMFYKVKKMGKAINNSNICREDSHNLWASAYLEKQNFDYKELFNLRNSLIYNIEYLKTPNDILVDVYGFVYYSHDTEYYKPIIIKPNYKINGKSISKEQKNLLFDLLLLRDEYNQSTEDFIENSVENRYVSGYTYERKII